MGRRKGTQSRSSYSSSLMQWLPLHSGALLPKSNSNPELKLPCYQRRKGQWPRAVTRAIEAVSQEELVLTTGRFNLGDFLLRVIPQPLPCRFSFLLCQLLSLSKRTLFQYKSESPCSLQLPQEQLFMLHTPYVFQSTTPTRINTRV